MFACLGLLLNLINADKTPVYPKFRVILSAIPGLGPIVLETELEREIQMRTVSPHQTLLAHQAQPHQNCNAQKT